MNHIQLPASPPAAHSLASDLARRCEHFLLPLLTDLDQHLDRRLVRTLAASVTAIIRHRNRPHALLLSELGAFLTDPQHAPAGTKRLANLLHSPNWHAQAIDDYLLSQGASRVAAEAASVPEGRALCILDGSVFEKPESAVLEGLRPVRSSKARRLSRPRPKLGPGYYRGKPQGPIVVPGFQWLSVLVTAWAPPRERRAVTLGAWYWYAHPTPPDQTPPSAASSGEDDVPRLRTGDAQRLVLQRVVERWGVERLFHVWDRGLSSAAWLGEALAKEWQFVVRWKKGNHLRPAQAPSVGKPGATASEQERDGKAAWKLTAGLRAWGRREVVNPRHPEQPLKVEFAAREVRLLHRDEPLWLVVARLKGGGGRRGKQEPWRLLTTERVESEEECWRVVEAYAARWAIEQMLRFGKSELGVESVRVRKWEPRHKLLGLVSLAYAYLVEVLGDCGSEMVAAVLRWAHRTGRQANGAWRSLYRFRSGLAALWQRHTPTFQGWP